ncbi:DNA polymerase Y family protein [Streptomyces griseus]|uniref:DNA polymerase Y family protein n=1 Tax=Streptomyces griseus TaxID=1911 RepID=UPI003791EECD
MTTTARQVRHVVHLRFELPDHVRLEDLRPLLEQVTPQVQLLAPDSAVLDVTGALRFWDRDASEIARLIQLRAAAHHGVRAAAATAPSRMAATMACALTPPGQLRTVDPAEVETFLRPRPIRELPGVGPSNARLLSQHGVHTVGGLADLPVATAQRLLGARTGRLLHDRAHGRDPRPVVTEPVARSTTAEHRFDRDELNPGRHRRALLHLAGQLGTRMRTDAQTAAGLTITVRYADGSTTTRTRSLAEATHHTTLLARCAYDLYATLGLQRARVRSIALRAEHLRPAEHATRQLTFDHTLDKALLIEAVQDRARQRYGTDVIKPAALADGAGQHDRARSA